MNNRSIYTFVKLMLSVTCLTSTLVTAKENTPSSEDNKKSIETKQALYKTVDANGNISYSDKPSADSTKIPMPEGQSINLKPPKVNFHTTNDTPPENENSRTGGYSEVSIIQPENDGVLRNNGGTATFEVSIKPKLAPNHQIIFFIDGKAVKTAIAGMSITVTDVEYGTHSASFAILDHKNKQLIKSDNIQFNLLHTVRRKTGAAIQNNSAVNQINSDALVAAKLKITLPEHPKPVNYDDLRKREN